MPGLPSSNPAQFVQGAPVLHVADVEGVHLFQWVKDVDAYFREVVDRGAHVATEPTNQPYGIREFGVRDINGVGIVFGQDIEPRT